MPAQRCDIAVLDRAFAANAHAARMLVSDLPEELGGWSPDAASWSVAECLDHLAIGNSVYVRAMEPAAQSARVQGRGHRRPARPGLVGGWFVRLLEPPVTRGFRMKAPSKIRPRYRPALADATERFFASHKEVCAFLRAYADIDLAGVRFANPFIPGIRFSLATGLHVLAAHERRHLWQAWRVRRTAEDLND